ncbi:uncharacterized protein BX664DRAFT_361850 [Halteromyces radiatus]|uniref:uncharacterized protein n=1 Tax=Halteromyces radiatus TaxID=101107 RepID=UPI002220E774|nr:uncharacterized protein BX664DRAFT_361850 [Halteromyces radiatus]KAI8081729.1 hypothetical protein BX664DRAFT_361850 [Halteromyces radiatus]
MSSNKFSQKWVHSSRGLPGSFLNENHHTMGNILANEEDRQNMIHEQNINTDIKNDDTHGQVPQRMTDPHQGEQQSTWDNTTSDSYSRAKDQFPSATMDKMFPKNHVKRGIEKIDQQPPPPPHHDDDDTIQPLLENDPDPATKSAFQPQSNPITMQEQSESPSDLDSAANSMDSNRAILNQPLVSQRVNDQANTSSSQDTTEDDSMQQDRLNMKGGPLDTSKNKKENTLQNSPSSPPTWRRRHSASEHDYCAALPVLQSYVPYAQGVAAKTNNEARYENQSQQIAASDRRYSLHSIDHEDQQHDAPESRRRSSLSIHSISKWFSHHKPQKST